MEKESLAPRGANPLAPYMALAALWLLTLTIVPPRGDFPLNDDWMYAKVVKHLVDTGRYEANPYIDPTFILQAYWGAAFVEALGFSFETLRASTLVLALVALWAAHWCAREAGLNKPWSLFVAASFLGNPLFLNLSYTFMTDVPLIAVNALAGACYLRALRTRSLGWLWVAGAMATAAFFIRQFGILLPLAAAAALTVQRATDKRWPRLAECLALLFPLATAFTLNRVLPTGGLGVAEGWDWSELGDSAFARILTVLQFLAISALYLALFVAPFFIAGRIPTRRADGLRAFLIFPVGVLLALLVFPTWTSRLPQLGNVLYDVGVGPLLMPGMLDGSRIAAPLRLGDTFWRLLTVAMLVFGAVLMIVLVDRPLRQIRDTIRAKTPLIEPDLFLVFWAAATVVSLAMPPVHARFDRYLLAAQLPICIVLSRDVAGQRWMRPRGAALVLCAAMFTTGLVCLQDYLAWNGARWKALTALQREHGAALDQINGGYEFNGWYHSDHFAEESRRTGHKVFGPLGWWTLRDDYRVSLRGDRHFEVIGRESYFSWLGFQHREMLTLKRTRPDENSALFH